MEGIAEECEEGDLSLSVDEVSDFFCALSRLNSGEPWLLSRLTRILDRFQVYV